jgi:solute carrier family 25 phosphate transporter 3
LAKQIPYAIGQFTVNERCTEAIYKQMSPETKANLGPVQNLSITLGSGIVAGFAAAILSHVNFTFFTLSSLSRHTDL